MIESISIKDYALIKELNIDLSPGLNVLTGETGAGKSIIIDALTLILGARASKSNIRKGSEKLIVSAQITGLKEDQLEYLKNLGIEIEDTAILTREVFTSGRSVCRINGQIVSLNVLKTLGENLVDIHSQNANQALLQSSKQRDLLDNFFESEEILKKVSELTNTLKSLANNIRDLQENARQAKREQKINKKEFNEIEGFNLQEIDEEDLNKELTLLEKAEVLVTKTQAIKQILSSNEQTGLTDLFSNLIEELSNLKNEDPFFEKIHKNLSAIYSEIESYLFDLIRFIDQIDFNPERLNYLQNKSEDLKHLKQKYGESIEKILSYQKELSEKLYLADSAAEDLEKLKKRYTNLRNNYNNQASLLTKNRKEAASNLEEAILKELADLGMQKARFKIQINSDEKKISANGQDNVEFLIAVNPGSSLKPIKAVASGGEISRIMLALKSLESQTDLLQTLIFDEIDTGISGRTAQTVAEKIKRISNNQQVICITHLPQIAAMGDKQYLIKKDMLEEDTMVNFEYLEDEKRVEELARMLGGKKLTQKTLDNAKELIDQAKELSA